MHDRDSLITRLGVLRGPLKLDALRSELASLDAAAADPGLWEEQERAVSTLARQTDVRKLLTSFDDAYELLGLDEELPEADLAQLAGEVEGLERRALLSGRYDARGAIVTVHACTGGVDAQDWAQMLERMLLRFIEQGSTEAAADRPLAVDRSGWKSEITERNEAEEAGIKRSTFEVSGLLAYGLLKGEAGVHRLVRLSPFNAKNLRQTSFALIEVLPVVPQSELQIKDDDLRIDTYRSGGAGGQHVNTTDSAVRITHLPTGIVVAVQNERSQGQNKATAMKLLSSRLAAWQQVKDAEQRATLRGEFKEGTWGNQIRSYVLQPYQMVKDHRTGQETSDVRAVLDGALAPFIEAELTRNPNETNHG